MFFINDCCYEGISMRLLYCIFFLYTPILSATEYAYPVASLDNGKTILYIHQISPTNIELLSLNTQNQLAEQILWSIFNPAGLQMLPDNSGFSFIDNGRLHIKQFQKRSAKSIDFDEPLFGINSLHWIDNHNCYCSAQYNDNFALFELHDDGTLQCLRATEGKDYMYPQKIDNQLFYIERCKAKNNTHDTRYRIASCLYLQNEVLSAQTDIIADFNNKPIIFLTMISNTQGFVVEHAAHIDNENPTTSFVYHHLIKKGDIWSKKALFSFLIPINLLLDNETKLYESILPLLPRIEGEKIYFVDCSKNTNHILKPYFYDLVNSTVQEISIDREKKHAFVPMLCGTTLYSGGSALSSILT